ncbi:hypothetical protein Q8A73_024282 [Channa argus]|nr:hypothetical protein Q8A73_024282 [Channa argus]
MMSGLAEGGRDVPDLPLKLDTIFVASLLQDMASEVGHPASLGMKYFFLYAARGILNWSNVSPRSEQLPWHYAWVAKWLRAHPEALEDGIWKQQRVLYRVVRGKVNPSLLLGVPSSVWVGVQAVGLSNGQKDLNWACLHRTLPVRDKIHRHGLGRSPLCPRPSCGAGETAYHVMWECSFTRQLWAKAKKVVGRAKPDLTLTWQVVERGFEGAHIRSGWGILWLLLSLYKRGLWLARQELLRNGVEWSGLQRGWLRGSNGREVMPRDLFCTRIIKGQLNLTVEDIFCIQWHQQATGFLDRLSTVPGSAAPRCSRFCCTQMLKVLKGFSTPLHSPAEAIRADASVRVTLVPGGGDLWLKLSQYTDDTTLLLDSDECVDRTISRVGLRRTLRFQWRSSDREVMPRDLFCTRIIKGQLNLTVEDVFCIQWHQQATGFLDWLSTVPGSAAPRCSRFCCTQMLKVLKGFSTPPAFPCRGHQSRRQCEGDPGSRGRGPTGRYEWVARGRMMSGLAEGGRDVPDLPLKLDTIFVASLLQDMASEVGHPASLGMKYFFIYAARGILNWSNVSPRSEQLPWHYAWVAKWLRAHPEALEDGIWKQQRVLYRVVRGKVNPSPLLGVPSSVWVGVQAVGLSNGQKDLNWACLHRTLPVRDKIHRHGLGRSPLCPRPSCGAGETAYHVMWECSFARQLWAKAKKVVGRAKPDLTLTWQVVERGFVGAHIRSGWGILWLLLSLYKRGLWLARQELVRNEVEWSGVQRGWLRGSN